MSELAGGATVSHLTREKGKKKRKKKEKKGKEGKIKKKRKKDHSKGSFRYIKFIIGTIRHAILRSPLRTIPRGSYFMF